MISLVEVISVLAGSVFLAMAVNGFPAIWSSILPWLRPPYMLLVMNGIIIAIAVASRFRWSQSPPPVRSQHLISVRTPPPDYYAAAYESEGTVMELKPVMVNGLEVGADAEGIVAEDYGENAFSGRNLTYSNPPPEVISSDFRLEYFPPANPTGNIRQRERAVRREKLESSWKTNSEETSRAAVKQVHRPTPDCFRCSARKSKSLKERMIYIDSPPIHASSAIRKQAPPSLNKRVEFDDVSVDRSAPHNFLSPEVQAENLLTETPYGNILETGDGEEEYETMESVWKKVMDGASRAAEQEEAGYIGLLARPSVDRVRDNVTKSRSFKEMQAVYDDSSPSRASSRMGKEVPANDDEFNRRVEAFIKKVNEEIRSCRQKSLDQYIQLNSAA